MTLNIDGGGVPLKEMTHRQSGLTSTQVLIVLVVIGIVAAVILAPKLLGQAGKAQQAQAVEEIEKIGIALDRYAKDNGDYPSTETGVSRTLGET